MPNQRRPSLLGVGPKWGSGVSPDKSDSHTPVPNFRHRQLFGGRASRPTNATAAIWPLMTLPGQNSRWPQNNRRIAVYHLPDKNGHSLFIADSPFNCADIIADDWGNTCPVFPNQLSMEKLWRLFIVICRVYSMCQKYQNRRNVLIAHGICSKIIQIWPAGLRIGMKNRPGTAQ